jgi:hypothetical protein
MMKEREPSVNVKQFATWAMKAQQHGGARGGCSELSGIFRFVLLFGESHTDSALMTLF